MVHRVQQPYRPLPFPDPNFQHQAQYDQGANISANNNIFFCETPLPSRVYFQSRALIELRRLWQRLYAAPLFFRSRMILHIIYLCNIVHPLHIPLYLLSTSQVPPYLIVGTMDTVSWTCQVTVALSCRIIMIIMRHSLHFRRVTIWILLMAPLDLVFLVYTPNPAPVRYLASVSRPPMSNTTEFVDQTQHWPPVATCSWFAPRAFLSIM
jgi:hypothetical protein